MFINGDFTGIYPAHSAEEGRKTMETALRVQLPHLADSWCITRVFCISKNAHLSRMVNFVFSKTLFNMIISFTHFGGQVWGLIIWALIGKNNTCVCLVRMKYEI